MKKYICKVLFVMFRHWPASQKVIFGKVSKFLRAVAAKGFIRKCGTNVNIEHGAVISSKLSMI